uniref:Uncharacterized protein n=1 Tax=Haptolina ericina TaxID=156174 RepID=A0A7S3EUI1_9EUKA|mmetsp:Transcript_19790/g.44183  ORF Transcript_19790/g.44183 Transcript_19790/m.44183 type:complete len:222 (+) Transcript_19790:596-1261(+)
MAIGVRTFYAAYVIGIKRVPRPYKLGKKVAEVALQVRTSSGSRLLGMDALSNEMPLPQELSRFKVPLQPEEVRKKLRGLERAFAQDAELFEAEELERRRQQETRAELKREEQIRREQAADEERERREQEREEVRRRLEQKKQVESDQWWLHFKSKPGGKEREIAKWRARLKRFEAIAANSSAEGEKANATKLATQAREKIDSLLAAEEEQQEEEGVDGEEE